MQRVAYEIATDQVIVVFVTSDDGSPLAPGLIFREIASDAAARAPFGWRITTMTTLSLRQMGTGSNMVLQSGGQFDTQAAVAVLYSLISAAPTAG